MGKKEVVSQIKRDIKHLMKYKDKISLIYAYGSFVYSDKETYDDIDVLIILDDFVASEGDKFLIESEVKKIEKNSKENLHVQSTKKLSLWWKAVIQGEPWILTSIKNSKSLYDKSGILSEIKQLVKLEKTYNKLERAERLLENSSEFDNKNREILLNSIFEISNAITEILQVYLSINGIFLLNKTKILLPKQYYETCMEVFDLENKVNKGTLNEFTAENLDYYLSKTKELINQVEKQIK